MTMLGVRLKQLRKAKGMTQQALALKMNVATNTLAQWEYASREPNLSTVIELAEFFSVSTDYLLGRTDKPLEQKFGNKSVEIAARPLPIDETEPQPEPVQAQKKLTGTESHEELEALVRRMVEEALQAQKGD